MTILITIVSTHGCWYLPTHHQTDHPTSHDANLDQTCVHKSVVQYVRPFSCQRTGLDASKCDKCLEPDLLLLVFHPGPVPLIPRREPTSRAPQPHQWQAGVCLCPSIVPAVPECPWLMPSADKIAFCSAPGTLSICDGSALGDFSRHSTGDVISQSR
jgi:hypothetical protein